MDMNGSNCDKLDNLLSASLSVNIEREARAFLSQDISGIRDDPKFRSVILRNAERGKTRSKLSASRIALIACLAAIALLLSACIGIPKVRESIWNTIVEWYDDHIGIHFSHGNDAEDNHDPSSEPPSSVNTPTSIEQQAYASYLPSGFYAETNESSFMFLDIFYYDREGNMQFKLMQTVLGEIDTNDLMVDKEADSVSQPYINGYEGLLIEYPDVPGLYYLVWQDKSYQYSLYGSFESKEELIRIAEGVKVK